MRLNRSEMARGTHFLREPIEGDIQALEVEVARVALGPVASHDGCWTMCQSTYAEGLMGRMVVTYLSGTSC